MVAIGALQGEHDVSAQSRRSSATAHCKQRPNATRRGADTHVTWDRFDLLDGNFIRGES